MLITTKRIKDKPFEKYPRILNGVLLIDEIAENESCDVSCLGLDSIKTLASASQQSHKINLLYEARWVFY